MNDTTRELKAVPDALDGRTTSEAALFEIRRVIVGQDAMLERVLVALLAGGHLAAARLAGCRPFTPRAGSGEARSDHPGNQEQPSGG